MKTKFIRYSFLFILSSLIGISFYFMPSIWGFLFCFFCLLLVFYYLKSFRTPTVVYLLIISAVFIRIILANVNNILSYSSNTFDLMGDASAYTSYGVYIAEVLTGRAIWRIPSVLVRWNELQGILPVLGHYQTTGMAYLQGIVFSAFGYSALGIKIFNSTLGVLIGVMVYCFLRRRIGVRSSIIALFLILFYPSLVIWSVTGLKDLLVIFTTILFLITVGKMINGEIKLKDIVLTIFILGLSVVVIFALKRQLLYLYSIAIIFSLFIAIFIKLNRLKKTSILLSIIFCLFLLNHSGFLKESLHNFFRFTINYQRLQYNDGGKTSYKLYPDRFYVMSKPVESILKQGPMTRGETILTYIKAVGYLIFTPMPMHFNLSKFLILIYPQSLFTLILFPFMLVGVVWALRYYTLSFTPLFIFMVGYITICAFMSGNLGTAIRHKDLIMPIYLMFSVIGISLLFGTDKVISGKSDKMFVPHTFNSNNQRVYL